MAAARKKTVVMSKSRASTFMAMTFRRSSARLVALGVERLGGGGERGAEVAARWVDPAELGERLPGGEGDAGLGVHPLADGHVPVEPVRVDGTDLEVHRGVVDAAELGAAAD